MINDNKQTQSNDSHIVKVIYMKDYRQFIIQIAKSQCLHLRTIVVESTCNNVYLAYKKKTKTFDKPGKNLNKGQ